MWTGVGGITVRAMLRLGASLIIWVISEDKEISWSFAANKLSFILSLNFI